MNIEEKLEANKVKLEALRKGRSKSQLSTEERFRYEAIAKERRDLVSELKGTNKEVKVVAKATHKAEHRGETKKGKGWNSTPHLKPTPVKKRGN